MYIQAASFNGLPTYFEIIPEAEFQTSPDADRFGSVTGLYIFLSMLLVVTVSMVVLAWRHWHFRRGDRRGAFRYAMVMLTIGLGKWLLETNHVGDCASSTCSLVA